MIADQGTNYSIRRRGKDVILTLRGHFTTQEAEESTEAFKVLVGHDEVRLVIDFSTLTGYDQGARKRWLAVLAPFKKQITKIVFVGNPPPLVRMAGAAVALAVGITMKFVSTFEEVDPA